MHSLRPIFAPHNVAIDAITTVLLNFLSTLRPFLVHKSHTLLLTASGLSLPLGFNGDSFCFGGFRGLCSRKASNLNANIALSWPGVEEVVVFDVPVLSSSPPVSVVGNNTAAKPPTYWDISSSIPTTFVAVVVGTSEVAMLRLGFRQTIVKQLHGGRGFSPLAPPLSKRVSNKYLPTRFYSRLNNVLQTKADRELWLELLTRFLCIYSRNIIAH